MDWLTSLLSQPITQLGGVAGVVIALHKAGIVDLKKALQAFLGTDGDTTKEINADNRNALQPLLSSMEQLFSKQTELKEYYNHTTTELLSKLIDGQSDMRTTQLVQCQKLDLMVESLGRIERDGIRIRS